MFKVSVFLLVCLFGKYILTIFASVNKNKKYEIMKIFKNELNGVNFKIVCDVWQTASSWGHVAKLFENDVEIGRYKTNFTSMFVIENYRLIIQCLINEVKKRAEKTALTAFLAAKGYKPYDG